MIAIERTVVLLGWVHHFCIIPVDSESFSRFHFQKFSDFCQVLELSHFLPCDIPVLVSVSPLFEDVLGLQVM